MLLVAMFSFKSVAIKILQLSNWTRQLGVGLNTSDKRILKYTRYPTISKIDIVSSDNVDEFIKATSDIFSYELRNTDIVKIMFKEGVLEIKKNSSV